MAVAYGYPPENMTGIIGFLQYVNSMTGGFLGLGFLIIIFMVSFLSTKSFTYERAFGFSAFLTMVSAVLLRFMSLINDTILAIFVVILVVAIIFLMKERSSEGV